MVTSITPILEQNMPRAQARAGGQNTYSAFEFCAYCDPPPSAAPLTKQTPAQSEYTFTNCTGANLSNQQYSITSITNSTGAISERYAYTAYGQPTIFDASGSSLSPQVSSLNNRYTYTGREWDATLGLYHFRARWMSPSTGRFLCRDPVKYKGSPWNLYEFLQSAPVSGVDSLGHQCETPKEPQVITKPKDKESVSGMPYGKADLSRFDADGLSLPGVRTWCDCASCCDKTYYIWDYGIEVEFYIWLDLAALSADPETYIDEDTPSLEGVYGHEQRHVINMFDAIPGLVSSTAAPNGSFNSLEDCENSCRRFQDKMAKDWMKALVANGGHSDPNRVPIPGTMYPPIGTMPAFPDPKHPRLPRN
ncbi:MAG: RHS repeat domain-containing protein [Pirellula sp.]